MSSPSALLTRGNRAARSGPFRLALATPLALATLLAVAAPTPARAAVSLTGTWTVTTRLVAAQEKINPDYEVGDARRETWRITTAGDRSTLRSPVGTVRGRRAGKAWAYDGVFPFADPVVIKVHIVARRFSARGMRGTTEASYWDVRYARGGMLYDPGAEQGRAGGYWDPSLGLKLGLDAWSFRGTRR